MTLNLAAISGAMFSGLALSHPTLASSIPVLQGDWTSPHLFALKFQTTTTTAADVDADGDLDLVSVIRGERIVWQENFDETGESSAIHVIAVADDSISVHAVEDMDGDGDLDVLASERIDPATREIQWYENRGSGHFDTGPRFVATRDVEPLRLVRVDVDADGWRDIVGLHGGDDQMFWHRNLGPAMQFSYAPSAAVPGAPSFPAGLEAADLNGDGLRELLVSHVIGGPATRATTVLWNQPGGGFIPSAQLFQGLSTQPPKVGDLNGDALLDVFVLDTTDQTAPRVLWSENEGAMSLAPEALVGSVAAGAFSSIQWISAEDLDDDGNPEVLLSAYAIGGVQRTTLFEHIGGGSFSSAMPLQFADEGVSRIFEVADMDGDGFDDILDVEHDFPDRPVTVSKNLGSFRFGPRALYHARGGRTGGVLHADFDGDADVDIVHLGRRIVWFENLLDGRFQTPRVIVAAETQIQWTAEAGDLDGDGDIDIVGHTTVPQVIENLGSGSFGSPISLSGSPYNPGTIDLVDIDGDGTLYITGAGELNGIAPVVWRSTGTLTFAPPVLIAIPNLQNVRDSAWADIDGDGLEDYVALLSEQNMPSQVLVAVNRTMPGGFADLRLSQRQTIGTSTSGTELRALDLDGDGDRDVAAIISQSGMNPTSTVEWLENSGGRLLPARTIVPSTDAIAELLPLDIDGDGVLDLVASTRPKGNSFRTDFVALRNDGAMNYTVAGYIATEVNLAPQLAAPDLDLDGDRDLVFGGFDSGWIENLQRFGMNECGPAPLNSAGHSAEIVASGSRLVADNDFELTVTGLPPGVFGMFLAAQSDGFVPNPGGSAGNLCLGGSIGRQTGPGQILGSGMAGEFSLALDLTSVTMPTGSTAVASGETWWFQAWYRDGVSSAGSNFSDAVRVRFE